jgi:hypothetical protein
VFALKELPKASFLLAAARRFCILLVATATGTVFVSLGVGFLAGSNPDRSISVGFYVVGCLLLVCGFFVGNRGPARPKGEEGPPLIGPRFMRWATPEEREDTLNISAVFVTIGFILVVLGAVVDSRVQLF